ncbi:hypothetical protein PPYR_00034 [Photinus pyralis]|uniref:DDE-1 domain-containing protein n=1 Tax=Photinus pyralis TaxID=7054 RepID=A0A5N4B0F7_PHOPY|nr:hypothetical protein PPYR_00034 [Photinus pyralis]
MRRVLLKAAPSQTHYYNLASHFTEEVIRLCEENDIGFVCLPKNATHLCQPLDVGFLDRLKWPGEKFSWTGRKHIPLIHRLTKKDFPQLLQTILLRMDNKDKIKKRTFSY